MKFKMQRAALYNKLTLGYRSGYRSLSMLLPITSPGRCNPGRGKNLAPVSEVLSTFQND